LLFRGIYKKSYTPTLRTRRTHTCTNPHTHLQKQKQLSNLTHPGGSAQVSLTVTRNRIDVLFPNVPDTVSMLTLTVKYTVHNIARETNTVIISAHGLQLIQ